MRARMESWILRQWYGTGSPPWFLRMLEPVYRTLFQWVQAKGRSGAKRYRSALPLVVIGNITAGGSGKTPLVMHLCQLAMDLSLRPGIASTGYGRLGSDITVVGIASDPRTCGDEPVMLARRTGVPVVVASRRIDAIKKLNEQDLDVIFSDDGLQHAEITGDIQLCVIDGSRGLGNGHLLPAGPLRESAARLNEVDFVVSNGIWPDRPHDTNVFVMHLVANQVGSLDGKTVIPVTEFQQKNRGIKIHAIAGIGNPERFFKMLVSLGIEATPHEFPDHHPYTQADFCSMDADAVIVMTEKDAVKCRSLGLANAWYIPVETRLADEFENGFKDRLTKLMKERT